MTDKGPRYAVRCTKQNSVMAEKKTIETEGQYVRKPGPEAEIGWLGPPTWELTPDPVLYPRREAERLLHEAVRGTAGCEFEIIEFSSREKMK